MQSERDKQRTCDHYLEKKVDQLKQVVHIKCPKCGLEEDITMMDLFLPTLASKDILDKL